MANFVTGNLALATSLLQFAVSAIPAQDTHTIGVVSMVCAMLTFMVATGMSNLLPFDAMVIFRRRRKEDERQYYPRNTPPPAPTT